MNSYFVKLAKYYAFLLSVIIFGLSIFMLVIGFQLTGHDTSQEGQGFGIIGVVFGFIGVLISLVFFLLGTSIHSSSRKVYVIIVLAINMIVTFFMFWLLLLI